MKHLPKILAVLMFAIFAGATVAYAQSYTPLAPLPGTVDTATGKTDLTLYLAGSLKLLIALGAGLAVLFAVIGGTQYVAASINPSAKADALGRVWGALIGLTIILASYLLLNSINPKLVEFDFMLPPVGGAGASPSVTPSVVPPATTTPTVDSAIEALNLSGSAKAAAYKLKELYPSVVFTSGSRTLESQAHAMATNSLSNRQFIAQTYTNPGPAQKLQTWLNNNPSKTTLSEIEAGFISVLKGMTEGELLGVSKHLSGNAFDVSPGDSRLKAAIQSLPGLKLFLDKEGGLTRWHAQF